MPLAHKPFLRGCNQNTQNQFSDVLNQKKWVKKNIIKQHAKYTQKQVNAVGCRSCLQLHIVLLMSFFASFKYLCIMLMTISACKIFIVFNAQVLDEDHFLLSSGRNVALLVKPWIYDTQSYARLTHMPVSAWMNDCQLLPHQGSAQNPLNSLRHNHFYAG